jgi:hypothetical protein
MGLQGAKDKSPPLSRDWSGYDHTTAAAENEHILSALPRLQPPPKER